MRPDILTPLFASVSSLPGAGPKLAARLPRLLVPRSAARDEANITDLILHFPSAFIDRRFRPDIAHAEAGMIATILVTVDKHMPPPPHNRRLPYRVHCFDDSGELELVFFHARGPWLREQLPEGAKRYVSGRVEHFNGKVQMAHPDYMLDDEAFAALPPIEPVYPLTEGVSNKVLGKLIAAALTKCPELPEWQDPSWIAKQNWPPFREAVLALHHPEHAVIDPEAPARLRLAYDEFLASQLALTLVRAHMHGKSGQAMIADGSRRKMIMEALPYKLTGAQTRVLDEIAADLASNNRMLRLLQGDVGAGKTIVALLSLAMAVEAGFQGAMMAPTDLLARQHLAALQPLCDAAGIRLALLTAREKGARRRQLLQDLQAGDIDILIGTHALLQPDVEFHKLGLVIIDEQHRFGVRQRLTLQAKGGRRGLDVLVMTATPIPRTLTLASYGDMDVSRLDERPEGRRPIDTRILPMARLEDVIAGVRRAVADGGRAYWVCPLIEDSDLLDVSDAENRFRELSKIFPGRAGLVHGRMKREERDPVMEQFRAGEIDVLVATTVIEVGVDVPEAGIMVIEHAERFGLAQLHQLRGRVGRGAVKSSCLLLYQGPLSETAEARLKILRSSEDGFLIAEEDLRLRGAGDLLGAKQSGLPEFRLSDLALHGEILAAARDDARLILAADPALKGPRGAALRTLLYLFERDAAIGLLTSG
ncbi:MAG: ATP-dependent DNA helicase RecG [Hyphomicrobiales bacterium]|nr:MAG: ATP-dependent DNA helicase RecG [Hyphomicrobiales bacterium]